MAPTLSRTADLAVCAATLLFVFHFCLAVRNGSTIISAPHTPRPCSGSAARGIWGCLAPLGMRGPAGPQHAGTSALVAAPKLPCMVTNWGEAAVINAVPLGSRSASNHVRWQCPGGSGSCWWGRAATPGHSPERAPAPCPEGLGIVTGKASSPRGGTPTTLSNPGRKPFF